MPTDAETAPARGEETSQPPPARKKKKGAKQRKVSRPLLTEAQINVPDKQTLVMMGVLTALAITLWVFAHAGCNYHPPRETRRPRDVTTSELVREPKDAAIEFQHRRLTLDYKGALEIAAGSLSDQIKQEQQSCASNAGACEQRRKAAVERAISSAVVLERTPVVAKVKVTTYRLPGGDKTFLNLVERSPEGWKVTAQVADAAGATLPAPVLPQQRPMQINLAPTPAPSGSAAPGLSGSPRVPAAPPALPPGHPVLGTRPAAPAAPAPAHS